MKESELLMHQLYQTVRAISKGLNRRLEPYGLYASEWTIIMKLKEAGSITQGELAGHLNIEPAAITKSLVKMEKKGLIERAVGADRRSKYVSLSAEALRLYPEWEAVVSGHRREILSRLSARKQTDLCMALKSIIESAQSS